MAFSSQPVWWFPRCIFARTIEQLVDVTKRLFPFAGVGIWKLLALHQLIQMPWENPVLWILYHDGKKDPEQMFSDEDWDCGWGCVGSQRQSMFLLPSTVRGEQIFRLTWYEFVESFESQGFP